MVTRMQLAHALRRAGEQKVTALNRGPRRERLHLLTGRDGHFGERR